ncbi:MAG: hypothetical protein HRU43_05315, partial [Simkaniaceae bacterium]|nr:hypothetical protein [Simkaniaceae bacterium]
MKTLALLIGFVSACFARNDPSPEAISYKEHQASPRAQENLELYLEALLLTSSLSTTYSEEVFMMNLGMYPNRVPVYDQKEASIHPDFNFGYRLQALYRTPPTRNSLYGGYTYIHNQGDGNLKSDNTSSLQDGTEQRNRINDSGNQHLHLHICDLIVMRQFPMYEHISFALGAGLTFNDFHYFFALKNDEHLTTTQSSGAPLSSYDLFVKSQRKSTAWGIGPKVEWHFGFHFAELQSNYDVSLNFALQLSTLFTKFWSKGNYS